jgi:hypothetical protein
VVKEAPLAEAQSQELRKEDKEEALEIKENGVVNLQLTNGKEQVLKAVKRLQLNSLAKSAIKQLNKHKVGELRKWSSYD